MTELKLKDITQGVDELKAIILPEDVHQAQVLNYLKAYKPEAGLLINFGSKSLTFKRLTL
jgi:GxxExxY protein